MFKDKKKKTSSSELKKDYDHEIKLLILGCKESGKTTALHQLQLACNEAAVDKKYFQRIIYSNTITTLVNLIEAAGRLGLKLSEDNKERAERILGCSNTMGEFRQSKFPLRLVWDFKCVWEDPAIQSAYHHSIHNPDARSPGRPQYYMDNMFRIFSPDFKPEDLDILSAYDSQDGVELSDVVYRRMKISAHCYPATTTESCHWDSLHDSPDVVIFAVNISLYDRGSYLHRSLEVLDNLIKSSKAFQQAIYLVILLNYEDLFMLKASQVDLKCCFPEYEGGLDARQALDFVKDIFHQKVSDKGKMFGLYSACGLDKKHATPILDEMIDSVFPEISKRSPPSPRPEPQTTALVANGNSPSTPTVASRQEGTSERRMSVVKEEKKEEKKKPKKKPIIALESGYDSQQGRRRAMEDTHVIMDNFRVQFPNNSSLTGQCGYYGVYDGHGGSETSKLVEQLLHKNILEDPQLAAGNFEVAIKTGFENTDKFILTQPAKSGSTAVIAMIIGTQLIVANAGDSEAILGRMNGPPRKGKYEPVVLSHKHLPTDEQEKQRISAEGGLVVFGRLFGSLAVSRSFGDREYKEGGHFFVSSVPHIFQQELTPQDHFIVMACDGLWDKLTYDDVINSVSRLRKEGKNATDISKALVQEALDKDSMDNVTCVVVFLQWKK